MNLDHRLAGRFLEQHPSDAARVLERLPGEAVSAFLNDVEPGLAAEVLSRATMANASSALAGMSPERSALVLQRIRPEIGAGCLRWLPAEQRRQLLDRMPQDAADLLTRLMTFPPESAGALMNPLALSFPEDMRVDGVHRLLHENARHAAGFVFVVDGGHRLVGVLSLSELMAADGNAPLKSVMRPATHHLRAREKPRAIITHPGWQEIPLLPVVDDDGKFLGAIHYRTLRHLEAQLMKPGDKEPQTTAQALGELFATGMAGIFEAAVTAAAESRRTIGGEDR